MSMDLEENGELVGTVTYRLYRVDRDEETRRYREDHVENTESREFVVRMEYPDGFDRTPSIKGAETKIHKAMMEAIRDE